MKLVVNNMLIFLFFFIFQMLYEDKDKFIGDYLVLKYDFFKIIKYLQENWMDIGFGIFGRYKSMEGEMLLERQYMEEIAKSIERFYKEFKIRINGDNGKKKILMSRLFDVKNFDSNYYF